MLRFFIVRQALFGVPLFLRWDGKDWSLLDFGDYEAWLLGALLHGDADRLVILLNGIYSQMRGLYLRDLPEPGDMDKMITLTLGGRDLLIRGEVPRSEDSRIEEKQNTAAEAAR